VTSTASQEGGRGLARARDDVVRVRPVESREEADHRALTDARSRANSHEAWLGWPGVGRFRIREGREIVVEPAPGVDAGTLRLFLLGPVRAVLLHQRGFLVLHASAVVLDGGAIAFLGAGGWGKSTLAAALNARGHALVADDIVAVRLQDKQPVVLAGVPELKLWPDAITALGEAPQELPRLRPAYDKRARPAGAFSREPVPLARVYVLAESLEGTRLEPLKPHDALIELVRHAYGARTLQRAEPARRFKQCAELVTRLPISRLAVRRSLAALPELVEIIERDAAAGP